MKKDLHKIDEVFNSAYKQFEEDPSAGVWEKIDAGLDKKDAKSYKRRFIGWKRTAILLLLLLTGFMLYESGILKTGPGQLNENTITKKTNTPEVPAQKHETTSQDHTLTGKVNNDESDPVNQEILTRNEKDNRMIVARGDNILKKAQVNSQGQQKRVSPERANTIIDDDPIKISVIPLLPGINSKRGLEKNESLSKGKITIPFIEKSNNTGIDAHGLKGIQQAQLSAASDFLLINNTAKNTNQKKKDPFNSYWTISGFVAYENANYRFDNDLQTVEKIKQREVHEPSFSAGALINWQIKKQWALQTGLIYSNTAIGISPQKMYASRKPSGDVAYKYITSSGNGYVKPGFGSPPSVGDSLTTADAKHNLQHIVVPVIIKYTIGKNKLSVSPGVGIAGNFLTSAKVETEVEDASNREIVTINKLDGAKSFYWSAVADAEVQYKLNKKISINLRPSFRYAISPITKTNELETFPYSFGLGAGLTYKF
jgi:hypothetical protein